MIAAMSIVTMKKYITNMDIRSQFHKKMISYSFTFLAENLVISIVLLERDLKYNFIGEYHNIRTLFLYNKA